MKKRLISAIVVLTLLCSLLPASAFADDLNVFSPSEEIVAFIKRHEGFRATAYWDYSQYTIGYGTKATEEEYRTQRPITEHEADRRLRIELAVETRQILDYANSTYSVLTQQIFDSLLSFTFNLGTVWFYNSNLARMLMNGFWNYSDLYIVNCFVPWSHAGGEFLPSLGQRRLNEAKVFVNRDYTGTSTYDFCYLKIMLNGGTTEGGNTVYAFRKGEPYGELPTVTLDGRTDGYWIKRSDGKLLRPEDIVTSNEIVDIVWEGDLPDPDTDEGDEPPEEPRIFQTDLPFYDITYDDWFYPSVRDALAVGLVSGYPDSTFRPNNTITRAEFITMLANFAQADCTGMAVEVFEDVPADEWYAEPIGWGYTIGIAGGTSETTFEPETPISRQDMASLLARYLDLIGFPLPELNEPAEFADADEIADYALENVLAMQRAGILSGYDEGGVLSFRPRDSATRAEVCTMYCNILEMMQG